jgi:hypothetical protein
MKDRIRKMEVLEMAKPYFICKGEKEESDECFI